jgi:uncharacterized protein (TIGR00369 family)
MVRRLPGFVAKYMGDGVPVYFGYPQAHEEIAVHSQLTADQGYTTLELKVSYLRGLNDSSGTVRAVGRVTSMGRRVAFAEATLHDSAGRLCATATSTLLVFDRPR